MRFSKLNLAFILLSVFMLIGCSKDESWTQKENSSTNDKPLVKEDNEINSKGLNATYGVEAYSSSSKEWYFDIINSEDPLIEYNRLTNQQKGDFWIIKYNVFAENSDLSHEQILYLNTLSDFVYQAQLDQRYDEATFNSLNKKIVAMFNAHQVMDLIFYFDTPSIGANWCFWCNEIVDAGPCEIRERPQGGLYQSQIATVQRYRFGIPWGTTTVEIPCGFV